MTRQVSSRRLQAGSDESKKKAGVKPAFLFELSRIT
jgi:hypothetical protein